MAKIKRNEPCPCGSGSKAKRCCQAPHEYVDVRVLPLDLCQSVVHDLPARPRPRSATSSIRWLYLPEIDASLQVGLARIVTPEMNVRSTHSEAMTRRFDRALGRSCRRRHT